MEKTKPILVFPYHDPDKVFFDTLIKKLPELQKIFGRICVSITPLTYERHASIPATMQELGCFVIKNKKNSLISDHYLNGLKLYQNKIGRGAVYFGFIDRILFALCSSHRKKFIADASKIYSSDMMIFSRSQKAWKTHPKDYYVSEKIVEDIGWSFLRKRFDWVWCGVSLSEKAVRAILSNYKLLNDFSVETDWILTSHKEKCSISDKKVDWLAWEDSFWAAHGGKPAPRQLSQSQKIFRLTYNVRALQLIHDAFDV